MQLCPLVLLRLKNEKNNIRTSKSIASKASKTLKETNNTKTAKSLAGSDLVNRKPTIKK